jgi:hypothetical protein
MSESPDEPLRDESPSLSTRVDTAHVRAGEQPAAQPAAQEIVEPFVSQAAPAECAASVTATQVRSQAAQLTTHLQRQQTAVDHRESELNARVAAMENQVRAARLWLDERHAEMAARKEELDRRERELEARAAHADVSSRGIRAAATSGAGGRTDIERRAAELERREAELEQMAARLAQRLAAAEQNDERRRDAEGLDSYRKNLERAETLLAGQQADYERNRRELDDQRARFAEAMQTERRQLAEEQQRSVAEHERVAWELKRQSDELAARRAALERMRADVTRAQHEALEIRLATEELWARLCGTMAPAALTQSLAQIRLKLAEERRLERAELAAQRAELHNLADQVARQHGKLLDARADAEAWVKARREELEQCAGALAARERQLNEASEREQQRAAEWHSERRRLEQEIRRLLRQAECAAAA